MEQKCGKKPKMMRPWAGPPGTGEGAREPSRTWVLAVLQNLDNHSETACTALVTLSLTSNEPDFQKQR